MHAAVKEDSVTCVRLMLDLGTVNINCRRNRNYGYIHMTQCLSPLHLSAFGNEPRVTEMLLRHGAQPDLLDDYKAIPASYASSFGKTENLKLLLRSLSMSGSDTSFLWESLTFFFSGTPIGSDPPSDLHKRRGFMKVSKIRCPTDPKTAKFGQYLSGL